MRILIADDHALFREGLKLLLLANDASTEILETVDFGSTLAKMAETEGLDLVLIDLAMPDMAWRKALPLLHQRRPETPLVVVSASDARDDIIAALNSGALGYIPKSSTGKVMLRALELVLSGGTYVPPDVVRWREQAGTPRVARKSDGLTPRQTEVLQLMSEGYSNKQIAESLNRSEGTVKLHVAAVLKALGAANRTEAVLLAVREGILSGPDSVRENPDARESTGTARGR
jgi:DNA-binding NarL/FixJ family response regulator